MHPSGQRVLLGIPAVPSQCDKGTSAQNDTRMDEEEQAQGQQVGIAGQQEKNRGSSLPLTRARAASRGDQLLGRLLLAVSLLLLLLGDQAHVFEDGHCTGCWKEGRARSLLVPPAEQQPCPAAMWEAVSPAFPRPPPPHTHTREAAPRRHTHPRSAPS